MTDVGEMERRKRAEELERLERRWREEGGGLEAAEDSADERSERFRVRDVSNKTRVCTMLTFISNLSSAAKCQNIYTSTSV